MSQQKAVNKTAKLDEIEPEATEPTGDEMIELQHHESVSSLIQKAREHPIPPFHASNFANYSWGEVDETSFHLLAGLDNESRSIYLTLGRYPRMRRYPLGTFRVDENHIVAFETIPALGDVSYSEIFEFPPGVVSPLDKMDERDRLSPLMRWLQLTEKTVPVPLVLKEFDDRSDDAEVERALAGRDLVDALDNYGQMARLVDVRAAPPTAAAAVWTCFNGGDDAFSSAYCESTGIWACDSGAWESLTRSSGSNRRYVSHSRVASCNDTTYLEHQFRYWDWDSFSWKWNAVQYPNTSQFWQIIPAGWVKYWEHVSSKKRRRKVKIWIGGASSSGYFRAWTSFHN